MSSGGCMDSAMFAVSMESESNCLLLRTQTLRVMQAGYVHAAAFRSDHNIDSIKVHTPEGDPVICEVTKKDDWYTCRVPSMTFEKHYPEDAQGSSFAVEYENPNECTPIDVKLINGKNPNKPIELDDGLELPESKDDIPLQYESIDIAPRQNNMLGNVIAGKNVAALCLVPFVEGKQLEWDHFAHLVKKYPDAVINHSWNGILMHELNPIHWESCYPALDIPRPKRCVLVDCRTLWGLDYYPKDQPNVTLRNKLNIELTIDINLPEVDNWKLIIVYY